MTNKTLRYALLGLVVTLVACAPAAWAQYEEEPHHDNNDTSFDTTLAPLVLPTMDEFDAMQKDLESDGEEAAKTSAVGIGSTFDVSSNLKAGSITPSYRFSKSLAIKLRVPYIFSRTMHYLAYDAKAGGVGDISFDTEYTHRLNTPGSLLRFQATVKLPTGDDEKVDTDEFGTEYGVPLGTGTVDVLARAMYGRTTAKFGYIGALLYRLNTPNETVTQFGTNTTTTNVYNANQIVASAFGRHRVGKGFWVHMGASVVITGDGKTKTETTDAQGNLVSENETDNQQGSTLVDIFPGISYDLGPLNPYLGMRLPLVSSYDAAGIDDSRAVSVVLQLSYNPMRMAEGR